MDVAEIKRRGFSVRLKPGGKIGISPPLGDDHELRAAIVASKPEIIEELRLATSRMVEGPGTELEKMIPKLYGCGTCRSMRDKMNEWGVGECNERFEEIVNWLVEQAKNRKSLVLFPEAITRPVAQGLVMKAIVNSRKVSDLS